VPILVTVGIAKQEQNTSSDPASHGDNVCSLHTLLFLVPVQPLYVLILSTDSLRSVPQSSMSINLSLPSFLVSITASLSKLSQQLPVGRDSENPSGDFPDTSYFPHC
jgi:hypothetical protein